MKLHAHAHGGGWYLFLLVLGPSQQVFIHKGTSSIVLTARHCKKNKVATYMEMANNSAYVNVMG